MVTVWWNASGHGARRVELRVADRPDGVTKLWTTGGASGRRDTGPWIQEGSVIQLHDAADGRLLERLVLENGACDATETRGAGPWPEGQDAPPPGHPGTAGVEGSMPGKAD